MTADSVSTALSRRTMLKAAVAMAGGAVLARPQLTRTLSAARPRASSQTFTLAYQDPPSYGMLYLADKLGWYRQAGIDPNLIFFTSGPAEIQAMVAGSIDVAAIGSIPVLQAAAEGALPIRIIDVMDDTGHGNSIVSTNAIKTVPQLRGKSIGLGLGTNDQYFIDVVLKKYGMTEQDVNLINFDEPSRIQAFLSGHIDAVVPLLEDRPDILQADSNAHILFDAKQLLEPPNPTPIPLAFDVLVTTEPKLRAMPQALAALVQTYSGTTLSYVRNHATRWDAVTRLTAWSNDIVKQPTDASAVTSKLASYTFYNGAQLGTMLKTHAIANALRQQAEFLVRVGKAPKIPEISTVLYPKFMEALSS